MHSKPRSPRHVHPAKSPAQLFADFEALVVPVLRHANALGELPGGRIDYSQIPMQVLERLISRVPVQERTALSEAVGAEYNLALMASAGVDPFLQALRTQFGWSPEAGSDAPLLAGSFVNRVAARVGQIEPLRVMLHHLVEPMPRLTAVYGYAAKLDAAALEDVMRQILGLRVRVDRYSRLSFVEALGYQALAGLIGEGLPPSGAASALYAALMQRLGVAMAPVRNAAGAAPGTGV